MSLDQTEATVPYKRLTSLFLCVILLALALTWTFLGMRAVMDVGGSCADGGPYVSAQPCPGGSWMLALSIPLLVIVAMIGSGVAIGLSAPGLLIPMWGLLFGSLGWNFLEYGAFSGDLVWGWIICGVVFELMALPTVFLMVPSRIGKKQTPPPAVAAVSTGGAWWWPAYVGLAVVGGALAIWSFGAWR
ncbi:hypothetical protein [Nocardioides sp.]|uniref:hypothetical protein n=1 Tax=Nocardioides sp. TaxID=35761 RepID=UPI0031FE5BDE|nr:hypothetical protein [Nocardioides sp.]